MTMPRISGDVAAKLALVALAAGALWLIAGRLGKVAGAAVDVAEGIVTGDNALTKGATNAAGEPTSAYSGAGILGTVGAGVNAASGGVLASIGEWIGGTIFNATHDDPLAGLNSVTAATMTQNDYINAVGGGQ